MKITLKQIASFLALSLTLSHSATMFVIGDAFPSNGTGNINSPTTGTNGNSGNVIDTVYQVSTGAPGNPFNGGNPGGGFSPLAVGNFFGTDYRTTLDFDLSNIVLPPAPAGQMYVVNMIDLFLEVSAVSEINGASVDVDIFTGQNVIAGPIPQTPDATFNVVNNSSLNGNFLPAIPLPTSSIAVSGNTLPPNLAVTLDVANPSQGIRFGSSLSTAANPNVGINGTNFAQIAPILVLDVGLVPIVPEPTSVSLLSLFTFVALSRRKRG